MIFEDTSSFVTLNKGAQFLMRLALDRFLNGNRDDWSHHLHRELLSRRKLLRLLVYLLNLKYLLLGRKDELLQELGTFQEQIFLQRIETFRS